jgi:hypothetical protein
LDLTRYLVPLLNALSVWNFVLKMILKNYQAFKRKRPFTATLRMRAEERI